MHFRGNQGQIADARQRSRCLYFSGCTDAERSKLSAYCIAGITLLLIAGGWVTVREYFWRKAAEKQAEIDALVEEPMAEKQAQNNT